MSTTTNKPSLVPRLRTYRDDLARAKGSTPSDEPVMKVPVPVPHQKTEAPIVKRVTKTTPKKAPVADQSKVTAAVPTPPSETTSLPIQKPFRTQTPTATQDLSVIAAKQRRAGHPTETNALDAEMATEMGDGMIVTDTRRDRFKLFPAIKDSLSAWLFEKKESFEAEQKPKHTIAPAETRRDVIERAATGGVLAPKNDYQQVASRLRHVPRVKVSTKPVVRDASEVPKPTWTHEVGEPAEVKPARPATPPQQTPAAKPAPKPEPEPQPAPEPPAPAAPQPKPKRVPRTRTAGSSRFSFRRMFAYAGITLVALAAAAAGFGIVSWFTSGERAPVTPAELQFTDPEFAATETIPVALGTTRTGLLTALANATSQGTTNDLTHIVPMVTEREEATAGEVLTVLAPNAPGAFIRAVTKIEFGAYERTPFVVIKVPNFDTALGGMLAWEQALDEDLEELFGTPVTATVRPTARTATSTAPTFIDIVHANRDMRVLYDASADEHLVYSFLDRTTVLITQTSDALTAIAPLIE